MAATSTTTIPDGLGDLGRLPPEVRKKVYSFALQANRAITISGRKRSKEMMDRNLVFEGNKFPKQDIVAKIILRPGKHEESIAVCQALVCGLVAASKAIQQEVTPVLYGDNHFIFSTEQALAEFLHKIRGRSSLLTRLTIENVVKKWVHLSGLKSMAKPGAINLQAQFYDTAGRNATDWATKALNTIKFIVTSQQVEGPQGWTTVRLLVQKQLERLDAFRFAVPGHVLFGGEMVAEQAERDARFRILVREVFRKEVEEACGA